MDLRDKTGRLIGKINQVASGRLEARDASGRLRGTYDPKSNETRDAGGRLVGKGDQLARLIDS